MLKMLRTRLNDYNKFAKDINGNQVLVENLIFSDDKLRTFLSLGKMSAEGLLSDASSYEKIPDAIINDLAFSIAVMNALLSQGLSEVGREFTITNAGVDMIPPCISEYLTIQYELEYKLFLIKLKHYTC